MKYTFILVEMSQWDFVFHNHAPIFEGAGFSFPYIPIIDYINSEFQMHGVALFNG